MARARTTILPTKAVIGGSRKTKKTMASRYADRDECLDVAKCGDRPPPGEEPILYFLILMRVPRLRGYGRHNGWRWGWGWWNGSALSPLEVERVEVELPEAFFSGPSNTWARWLLTEPMIPLPSTLL